MDPSGCEGDVSFGDAQTYGTLPDWLTVTQISGVNTFTFSTSTNNTGQTRVAYVGIFNLSDEILGVFRIFQISCVDQEWYPDQDSDGKGDASAVPRNGCSAPTDEPYGFVSNNDDLCPTVSGPDQGCPAGTAPENRNTITNLSYDVSNTLKAGNKSYFDEIGKLEQTQFWDVKSDSIWASATLYEEFGRPALQTMMAPISEGTSFLYKSGFIKKSDNTTDYDLSDFDGTNVEEPLPVGDSPTTLGWYFSENNNREGYQDISDYPFTKSIFSKLNPGQVLRAVGGNKVNGAWPQSYSFTMKASEELSLPVAFNDTQYNTLELTKTVTRDVHGVENVIFTDSDGKLLAAARSGGSTVSPSMNVSIPEQGFVDIHIAAGITGFSVSSPSSVRVYDLVSEEEITTSLSGLTNGFYRVAVNQPETYTPNTISVSYTVNYYDYSLNEYDEADRLIASYQPLNKLKTEYVYNTLGQLEYTKSPDEGESWLKYRKDGQIRFSQNSHQKLEITPPEFSYTNYDALGRPVESGVYIEGAITFANVDSLLENTLEDILIDNDGLSNANCKEQRFTLYDEPDTQGLHTALTSEGIALGNYSSQQFLAGNVSKTYTVNSGINTTTWYSYDVYGRVIWIVQKIDGLGTKTIDYEYDAITEQITQVAFQKEVPGERFIHRYGHNTGDQLIKVETSTDGTSFITHADYEYYESGALKRSELAGGIQGVDYVYNLAGQVKSINHPSLDSTKDPGGDLDDLFGMQIDYHSGDYQRNQSNINAATYGTDQLNGNIKGIRWGNSQFSGNQNDLYKFSYDRNNWLTEADYGVFDENPNTNVDPTVTDANIYTSADGSPVVEASESVTLLPGFHAQSGSNFAARIVSTDGFLDVGDGDYDVTNIQYDANGNIMSLRRNKDGSTGNNTMDDLTYMYIGSSNQLQQIQDASGDAGVGDIDNQTDSANYKYNLIGQLRENVAEGLNYIYNGFGLVTEVHQNSSLLVKILL